MSISKKETCQNHVVFLVQDDPFIEEITINICMCCNIHVLLISRVLPSCALLHFSILEQAYIARFVMFVPEMGRGFLRWQLQVVEHSSALCRQYVDNTLMSIDHGVTARLTRHKQTTTVYHTQKIRINGESRDRLNSVTGSFNSTIQAIFSIRCQLTLGFFVQSGKVT